MDHHRAGDQLSVFMDRDDAADRMNESHTFRRARIPLLRSQVDVPVGGLVAPGILPESFRAKLRHARIFGIDQFFSSLQNAALKSLESSAERVLLDFQTPRTWVRPKCDRIETTVAGLVLDLSKSQAEFKEDTCCDASLFHFHGGAGVAAGI